MVMRSREEIEKEEEDGLMKKSFIGATEMHNALILEVLLDIREKLHKGVIDVSW